MAETITHSVVYDGQQYELRGPADANNDELMQAFKYLYERSQLKPVEMDIPPWEEAAYYAGKAARRGIIKSQISAGKALSWDAERVAAEKKARVAEHPLAATLPEQLGEQGALGAWKQPPPITPGAPPVEATPFDRAAYELGATERFAEAKAGGIAYQEPSTYVQHVGSDIERLIQKVAAERAGGPEELLSLAPRPLEVEGRQVPWSDVFTPPMQRPDLLAKVMATGKRLGWTADQRKTAYARMGGNLDDPSGSVWPVTGQPMSVERLFDTTEDTLVKRGLRYTGDLAEGVMRSAGSLYEGGKVGLSHLAEGDIVKAVYGAMNKIASEATQGWIPMSKQFHSGEMGELLWRLGLPHTGGIKTLAEAVGPIIGPFATAKLLIAMKVKPGSFMHRVKHIVGIGDASYREFYSLTPKNVRSMDQSFDLMRSAEKRQRLFRAANIVRGKLAAKTAANMDAIQKGVVAESQAIEHLAETLWKLEGELGGLRHRPRPERLDTPQKFLEGSVATKSGRPGDEPLILYHATPNAFAHDGRNAPQFIPDDLGRVFTAETVDAIGDLNRSGYLRTRNPMSHGVLTADSGVVASHANIRKPLDLTGVGLKPDPGGEVYISGPAGIYVTKNIGTTLHKLIEHLAYKNLPGLTELSDAIRRELPSAGKHLPLWQFVNTKAFTDWAKVQGFDSIKTWEGLNRAGGRFPVWVLFDERQLRPFLKDLVLGGRETYPYGIGETIGRTGPTSTAQAASLVPGIHETPRFPNYDRYLQVEPLVTNMRQDLDLRVAALNEGKLKAWEGLQRAYRLNEDQWRVKTRAIYETAPAREAIAALGIDVTEGLKVLAKDGDEWYVHGLDAVAEEAGRIGRLYAKAKPFSPWFIGNEQALELKQPSLMRLNDQERDLFQQIYGRYARDLDEGMRAAGDGTKWYDFLSGKASRAELPANEVKLAETVFRLMHEIREMMEAAPGGARMYHWQSNSWAAWEAVENYVPQIIAREFHNLQEYADIFKFETKSKTGRPKTAKGGVLLVEREKPRWFQRKYGKIRSSSLQIARLGDIDYEHLEKRAKYIIPQYFNASLPAATLMSTHGGSIYEFLARGLDKCYRDITEVLDVAVKARGLPQEEAAKILKDGLGKLGIPHVWIEQPFFQELLKAANIGEVHFRQALMMMYSRAFAKAPPWTRSVMNVVNYLHLTMAFLLQPGQLFTIAGYTGHGEMLKATGKAVRDEVRMLGLQALQGAMALANKLPGEPLARWSGVGQGVRYAWEDAGSIQSRAMFEALGVTAGRELMRPLHLHVTRAMSFPAMKMLEVSDQFIRIAAHYAGESSLIRLVTKWDDSEHSIKLFKILTREDASPMLIAQLKASLEGTLDGGRLAQEYIDRAGRALTGRTQFSDFVKLAPAMANHPEYPFLRLMYMYKTFGYGQWQAIKKMIDLNLSKGSKLSGGLRLGVVATEWIGFGMLVDYLRHAISGRDEQYEQKTTINKIVRGSAMGGLGATLMDAMYSMISHTPADYFMGAAFGTMVRQLQAINRGFETGNFKPVFDNFLPYYWRKAVSPEEQKKGGWGGSSGKGW